MPASRGLCNLEIEKSSSLSPCWHQVRPHLDACQKCAMDSSPGLLVEALKSLHCELIKIRTSSSFARDLNRAQEKSLARSDSNQQINDSATVVELDDYAEPIFFRNVAEVLIDLERTILHINDEVDGDISMNECSFDDDYRWYNEMEQKISSLAKDSYDDEKGEDVIRISIFQDSSPNFSCINHERWIDRCLDVCGYAISMEVAVDCLRRLVHHSSIASKDTATTVATTASASTIEGNWNQAVVKPPGFSSVITSLRTIRRRLILNPASDTEGGINFNSFPTPFQHALSRLDHILYCQQFCIISECLILPLEYHLDRQSRHTNKQTSLSDSLSSLIMSVLPTLISSACYAKHLCLPTWAKSNISLDIMFQSAWRSVLVGELVDSVMPAETYVIPSHDTTKISEVAKNHFQLLVRQIIESGRSNMIARLLYKCWKSFDTDSFSIGNSQIPRSIFCRQIESIIGCTASKREVAMLTQAMMRHCVKHEVPKYCDLECHLSKKAREKLHVTCETDILPFLRDMLLPSIAKGAELAEALVRFMILSPPTSYHENPEHFIQSYPTLNAIDQAVPWCLAQLLALDCVEGSDIVDTSKCHDTAIVHEEIDDESDDDIFFSNRKTNVLLANLFAVALIWSEQVFITRTDTLQQQYVTEFLLHPLEWKRVTQDDLQKGLSNDGTTLAAILVQGVSLRLDVSRSESIRIDGMRVAEALASLLGQTLHFDELHQSDDIQKELIVDEATTKEVKVKEKRKTRERQRPKHRGLVVVEPDALVLDDSDSCSNLQSDSSTSSLDGGNSSDSVSSWGEDSLRPYDMDDDEEDLRRVPRPRNLRECLAYLISSENDDLTYDRHQSALTELVEIVSAQPLDLQDVLSILLRVLLHMEDKFNMDQFSVKRWDCLLTLGLHAPYETCVYLIGEMKESFAIRLEALFLVRSISQELSDINPRRDLNLVSNDIDQEICRCSTKLQRALGIRELGTDALTEEQSQASRTRRWRKLRSPAITTPNRFGPISVQTIYCMFTFLSQTRTDEIVWGGSTGERFLSEFLKTLAIMLHFARNHPSSALRFLAVDLFELAWSFRDAVCADVRHAALMAVLTCVSMLPLEVVIEHAHVMSSFLTLCSARDDNAECRHLAFLIAGSMSDCISQNLIG